MEAEEPLEELPKWFQRAVEAVKIGPSAVNGQPINFSWEAGDGTPVVRAIVAKENHNLEYNDDAALNELKLALREDIEGPAHETVDVASVNFTCALAVRRLLETVRKQQPQAMDQAFIEVDRLTKFIDHQLHECTPAALAQLPDLVFARVDELQTCLLGK